MGKDETFSRKINRKTCNQTIISTAGTIISFVIGGFDLALNSFIFLLFLDLFTGLLKAGKQNRISSYIGRQGREKIIGYCTTIIIANILEQAGMAGIRTYAILWATVMEGISFFENCDALDWWVPEIIRKRLLQTKEKKFGDM